MKFKGLTGEFGELNRGFIGLKLLPPDFHGSFSPILSRGIFPHLTSPETEALFRAWIFLFCNESAIGIKTFFRKKKKKKEKIII